MPGLRAEKQEAAAAAVMRWSDPAEAQLEYLVQGKPQAFMDRVRKRAEQITERIGAESVGWVEVQEACRQIETEDEQRR